MNRILWWIMEKPKNNYHKLFFFFASIQYVGFWKTLKEGRKTWLKFKYLLEKDANS